MAIGKGPGGLIPAGLRVMVIDEEPASLLFICTILSACHFTVDSFEDGIRALHALCTNIGEYDLVIADIHMVIMPAFRLVECIVRGLGIPVITTSVDDDPEIRRQAFMRGSCLHLFKPVTLDDMDIMWQKAWENTVSSKLRFPTLSGRNSGQKPYLVQALFDDDEEHHPDLAISAAPYEGTNPIFLLLSLEPSIMQNIPIPEPASSVANAWVELNDLLVVNEPENAEIENAGGSGSLTESSSDSSSIEESSLIEDSLTLLSDGVNMKEMQDGQSAADDVTAE